MDLLKFIVAKGLPRSIKAGLDLLGIGGGHFKSPLNALNEKEVEELKNILKTLNYNIE